MPPCFIVENSSVMVPRAGLEPARIAPHAPKACVSANFTTSAFIFSRRTKPSTQRGAGHHLGVNE